MQSQLAGVRFHTLTLCAQKLHGDSSLHDWGFAPQCRGDGVQRYVALRVRVRCALYTRDWFCWALCEVEVANLSGGRAQLGSKIRMGDADKKFCPLSQGLAKQIYGTVLGHHVVHVAACGHHARAWF